VLVAVDGNSREKEWVGWGRQILVVIVVVVLLLLLLLFFFFIGLISVFFKESEAFVVANIAGVPASFLCPLLGCPSFLRVTTKAIAGAREMLRDTPLSNEARTAERADVTQSCETHAFVKSTT
jgi:hypothetical protein